MASCLFLQLNQLRVKELNSFELTVRIVEIAQFV